MYPWYSDVQTDGLEQGDILRRCLRPEPPVVGSASPEPIAGGASIFDVVVLTQSCDLADRGVELVMVCPVFHYSAWIAEQGNAERRKSIKSKLASGGLIHNHLLNRCNLEGLEFEHLVTDFGLAFSVPLDYADHLAQARPRVRLLPPYREQLAQAFARFYMRVGLPSPADSLP
jgi:hypothetical protein